MHSINRNAPAPANTTIPEDAKEQPTYPSNADLSDLPATMVRRCCPGRECRNVTVTKAGTITPAGITYKYVGDTGETFFGPFDTVAELTAKVNDPRFWPIATR
ncbi:hypothetical protein [Leifsonia sp. Leaf264]|uniref:hypothetical protein n=1 Tax=Leifsonia sp. Leaf264 TaxID=1736314 RepID=UPI0006F82660|nr:hypothetical protein [Leifsonia sp. Leaf264]KQO98136.1 hypothetical protein ASF30_08655 [Leifsonia sp. Leaf264]